jgi:hypothetical protein
VPVFVQVHSRIHGTRRSGRCNRARSLLRVSGVVALARFCQV